MLAAGAFAAAGVGLALPPVVQVLVFAAVSVLGLVAVRPVIKSRLHRNAERAVIGTEALEGSEATVVEEVAQGRGMVKIGGELWTARPFDISQVLAPGEVVRVMEVKGA